MRSALNASRPLSTPPRLSRAARCVLLGLMFAGALLPALRPAPVAAHAALASSDPGNNAAVSTPPREVTLRFTEPLERSYSRAELYDRTGVRIAGATSRAGNDDFAMVLDVPPDLPGGTYSVLWRSLSTADGHTAEGYVVFTVGTPADIRPVMPPDIAGDDGPPVWLQTLARWLPLLGLAGTVAVWPIWLLVLRPAISPAWQAGPALTRRARRVAVGAIALFIGGSVLALVVQAAGDDGGVSFDRVVTTLNETRYGRLWQIRIGLVLVYAGALLACGWWWPKRRRALTAATFALAFVLPLPFSLVAHAAAQPSGRAVAIASDMAHLLGASLWVGGLAVLAGALLPTLRDLTPAGRRVVLAAVLPRFSAIALAAWGAMGITGLYAAWLHVGNLTALRDTEYGESLVAKVLLLLPLLALAGFNLLVVTRKLRRADDDETASVWSGHFKAAVVSEAVLVALVFLIVARLTGQPPARDQLAQSADQIALHLHATDRAAVLSVSPGATGLNHFRLQLDGAPLPVETTATLQLGLPSLGTGEQVLPMTRATGNAWEWHGSEVSIPGDWNVRALVIPPDEPEWSATTTLSVGTVPPAVDVPGAPWRFGPAAIVGLVLVILGIGGLALGFVAGGSPLRKEAAGLGGVAIALGAILLFQARLGPGGGTDAIASVNPIPSSAESIQRGSDAFQANCISCHGTGGRGDGPLAASLEGIPPADLTSSHSRAHADIDYFAWIKYGKEGTAMPAWSGTLDDEEIWDTVNYLRSLQDATMASRDAPAPDECVIEPRTVASLQALAVTPDPDDGGGSIPEVGDAPATDTGSAVGLPGASPIAGGVPADPETVAQINATARLMVACANARDTLKRLAVFSDDNIRPAFVNGPTKAFVDLVATPAVALPPELRVAVASVTNVTQLPDGRVSAIVTLDNPTTHSHDAPVDGTPAAADTARLQAARVVFVRSGERWLVDATQ